MKTYGERKQRVKVYMKRARARRIVWNCVKTTASMACLVAIIVGLLHIPYGQQNTSVIPTEYSSNPTQTPSTGVPTEPTVPIGTEIPPDDTTPNDPPEPQNSISVEIWVATEDMKITMASQIDQINDTAFYNKPIVPEFYVLTSDEVRLKLMEMPPDMWPDIICIDQMDLRYLAMCAVLTPFYGDDADALSGNNDDLSVNAAHYEGLIYGAPLYHADAYFLYYDRSVISDQEAESLESIIAACEKAGKKFCFDLNNPYYQATFYLGTGWYSHWTQDKDGNYISYTDNLNSSVGELALQGMKTLLTSSCYITPSQNGMYSSAAYEEAYKQSAAIVGGVWEYGMIVPYIKNLGITKLPNFQSEDGSYQLGSFANTMMLAVPRKNGEDGSDIAVELAMYLTNETNQVDNWYDWSWIPTNICSQDSLEDSGRDQAFVDQCQFAVPMKDFPDRWWDYLDDVPSYLVNGLSMTQILQDYERTLEATITDYPAQWFVVGQGNGSFWDAEYKMVCYWDNLLITDELLYFEEDSEFFIMFLDQNNGIKEFYGQDGKNAIVTFKPGVTGYYYVVYDPDTGECTLSGPKPE